MTIPSATMRRLRLKQATAASRASQAAAPAPVLRPPPARGGGGSGARGPAGRVHRTPPSSDKRQATTGEGGSNGGRDQVRAIRPAPPVPASAGKRCGTAPPASGRAVRDPPPKVPSAPPAAAAAAAAAGGNAAAVAVGDRVLVRTPVTPTLAGQHVVITLGAEVVSAVEEDGESYFDVVFDGEFPPHDPSSTVRITRDEIVMTTPAAATNPSPSSATTTSTTVPAPARPGKREAVGSAAASSLRGAGQQRSLQIVRSKRSRY